MKIFGLIGNPLGHSFSRKYFLEKFKREKITDSTYELFPLQEIGGLIPLIRNNPAISGLNVTIPYKQQVMDYLDEIDEIAREVNAVNCIRIERFEGKHHLVGFNTDISGFEASIIPVMKSCHRKALILGTGGGSRAAGFVFEKMGIPYQRVSRNPARENELAYHDLTKDVIEDHSIIVNTTPLGMFPSVEDSPPFPYQFITPKSLDV
jgi:shikimate dehydrogenase